MYSINPDMLLRHTKLTYIAALRAYTYSVETIITHYSGSYYKIDVDSYIQIVKLVQSDPVCIILQN